MNKLLISLSFADEMSMNKILLLVSTWFILFASCAQQSEQQYTNALINESSPYLLQHANNPVNWYPWGEEALSKAKKEGKLLVISIGYSACHWCHVMEHESYEDTVVSELMNKHYVSIKIDREERPDIDQVYIEAAQMLNGSAGWPLNVIALPDATPVFTGTYFPKDQWIKILNRIQSLYESDPDRLKEQSRRIMSNLKKYNSELAAESSSISNDEISDAIKKWLGLMDKKNGGLQNSQKFPLPGSYQQLLNYSISSEDTKTRDAVVLTLNKMALGGLFDHVGGGFHRYTVEPTWKIPHFEKMLYDNAQMISLYSVAYQVTNNPLYKDVVDQTINFIVEELSNSSGGFYSSYDADSEGEEGKYYVWTSDEIATLLGDDAGAFMDYFTITNKGNWEDGKNILYAKKSPYEYFSDKKTNRSLQENLDILKSYRAKRIKPGLDDKILTSWNALMLKGLVDAYRATQNKDYLNLAIANGNFILKNQLFEDGHLNRNYKDGQSKINGFLDDYAMTIQAFVALYQVTFDNKWLDSSLKLTEYCVTHFYNSERGLFRYKSDLDEALIVEKYTINDNVIPSGNSVMAINLLILGNMYFDTHDNYLDISAEMLSKAAIDFKESPYYHYGWLPGYQMLHKGFYEIAIVGEDYEALRRDLQKTYVPGAIYLGGDVENLPLLENKLVEGKTFIYVCKEKFCKLPVQSVEDALALLK